MANSSKTDSKKKSIATEKQKSPTIMSSVELENWSRDFSKLDYPRGNIITYDTGYESE